MRITTYQTPQDFLARTRQLLEQHEAANNALLGIAHKLIGTPDSYEEWHLLTADSEESVKVIALWTPPFNILIHSENPEQTSMAALARHFQEHGLSLPGVSGQVDAVRKFADTWTAITGGSWYAKMHSRIYEVRHVIAPTGVEGSMLQAGPDHQAVVADWIRAFYQGGHSGPITLDKANQIAQMHIERGSAYWWCVGSESVALAACDRQKTRHGATVNLVYTPPEKRGHGYASALVARVSQLILDSGKDFCALFTNLANPTSNRIYQRIGYRPVADFDELKFTGSASAAAGGPYSTHPSGKHSPARTS